MDCQPPKGFVSRKAGRAAPSARKHLLERQDADTRTDARGHVGVVVGPLAGEVGLVEDGRGGTLVYPVDKGSGATTSLVDADGIAWLSLDKADSDTNTLSRAVLEELEEEYEDVSFEKINVDEEQDEVGPRGEPDVVDARVHVAAEEHEVGQVGGIVPVSANQQPMVPRRALESHQAHAGPVV